MDFRGDQERTLWVADQMARHLAGSGQPLVRLYPGFLYGPGAEPDRNGLARLLCDHASGRGSPLVAVSGQRCCLALIDDVADGILRALGRAVDGSTYILGGENRTLDELLAAFGEATGIAPPRRPPAIVGKLAARLRRWGSAAAGLQPAVGKEELARHEQAWVYESERARRELEYRITPLDEAVAATAAWLRDAGYL
jgi:nucleoside-diphosphate-sugar epimerase